MINVTIGNNLTRERYNLDPNTTIRQALEDAGIDYGMGMVSLDGSTVNGAALDETFAQKGYTGEPGHDKAFLISVVKADNA